eukprot:GEMP01083550.1.p2 GENE.GEMP01083550.1~~GEMP01083550.1.p2  ORF type:complete len:134 (-),score=19.52 GEMP01083550.1:198-599(-)
MRHAPAMTLQSAATRAEGMGRFKWADVMKNIHVGMENMLMPSANFGSLLFNARRRRNIAIIAAEEVMVSKTSANFANACITRTQIVHFHAPPQTHACHKRIASSTFPLLSIHAHFAKEHKHVLPERQQCITRV